MSLEEDLGRARQRIQELAKRLRVHDSMYVLLFRDEHGHDVAAVVTGLGVGDSKSEALKSLAYHIQSRLESQADHDLSVAKDIAAVSEQIKAILALEGK